ncbi:MAG: hypothetical protein ACLFTH_00660 [Candidatus Woesearchaeota archaeon]
MTTDVSNKTVLILVVLAVIVSTLGTFTVVHTVNQQQDASALPDDDGFDGGTSGEVRIGIQEPADVPEATGQVLLEIYEPENDNGGVN